MKRVFEGLSYERAMRKARKLQDKGYTVILRLSYDSPGYKEYSVWVLDVR